jgi:dethiobiotin synthetase
VSTFHVTRFTSPYLFEHPVSPHLAARRAGRTIDLGEVVAHVDAVRREAEAVLVELPGGCFSPLNDHETNADLLVALHPTAILLVAPDRLGVLNDVLASFLAARSVGLSFTGIVLSGPEHVDASSGTNAAELRRLLPSVPVLATLPRSDHREALGTILSQLDWPDPPPNEPGRSGS